MPPCNIQFRAGADSMSKAAIAVKAIIFGACAVIIFGTATQHAAHAQTERVDFARQVLWSTNNSNVAEAIPRSAQERALVAQLVQNAPPISQRVENARTLAITSLFEPSQRQALASALQNDSVTPSQRLQLARVLHINSPTSAELMPLLESSLPIAEPDAISTPELQQFLSGDAIPLAVTSIPAPLQNKPQSPDLELARLMLIDEAITSNRRAALVSELSSAAPLNEAARNELLGLITPGTNQEIASTVSEMPVASQRLVARWLLLGSGGGTSAAVNNARNNTVRNSEPSSANQLAAQIENGTLTSETIRSIAPQPRRFSAQEGQSLLRSLAAGSGLSEELRGELASAIGVSEARIAEARISDVANAGNGNGNNAGDDQQGGAQDGGQEGAQPAGRSRAAASVSRIGSAAEGTPGTSNEPQNTDSTGPEDETANPTTSPGSSDNGDTSNSTLSDNNDRGEPSTPNSNEPNNAADTATSQRNFSDRLAIIARRPIATVATLGQQATRLELLADNLEQNIEDQRNSGESLLPTALARVGRITARIQPEDRLLQPVFARLGAETERTAEAIEGLLTAGTNPPSIRIEETTDRLLTTLDLAGELNQAGDRLTETEQKFISELLVVTETVTAEVIAGHLVLEDAASDLARRANQLGDTANTTLRQTPQDAKTMAAQTGQQAKALAAQYRRWAEMLPADAAASAERVAQEFDALANVATGIAAGQKELTAAAVDTLSAQLNRVIEACALLAPQLGPALRDVQAVIVDTLRSGENPGDVSPGKALASIEQAAGKAERTLAEGSRTLNNRTARLARVLNSLANDLEQTKLGAIGKTSTLKRALLAELRSTVVLLKGRVNGLGGDINSLVQRLDKIAEHCKELESLVEATVRPQIQFVGVAVGHLNDTMKAAPSLVKESKNALGMKLDSAIAELTVVHRLVALAADIPNQVRLQRAVRALQRLAASLPEKDILAGKIGRLAGELNRPVDSILANKTKLLATLRDAEAGLRADLTVVLREQATVRFERQQIAFNVALGSRITARQLGISSAALLRIQGQIARGERLDRSSLSVVARLAMIERNSGRNTELRGMVHEAVARRVGYNPLTGPVLSQRPPRPLREPRERVLQLAAKGQVWIPGYWSWNGGGEQNGRGQYRWVTGALRTPPEGRSWLPGRYVRQGDKFRRVPGAWIDPNTVQRIATLPPRTLEKGPLRAAPSLAHQWVPGFWDHDGENYLWKAGDWRLTDDTKVWTPPHFVLSERGVLRIDGYWDQPITERGTLFAPLSLQDDRARVSTRTVSLVALNSQEMFRNLFIRRGESEMYFGNLYGAAGRAEGFLPWSASGSDRSMFDPLFRHYESRFAQKGVRLSERLTRWEEACEHFAGLRPTNDVLASTQMAIARAQGGVPLASIGSLTGAVPPANASRLLQQANAAANLNRNTLSTGGLNSLSGLSRGGLSTAGLNASGLSASGLGGLSSGGLGGLSSGGLGGLSSGGLSAGGLSGGGLSAGGLTGGLSTGGLSAGSLPGGLSGGAVAGGLSGGLTSGGLSGVTGSLPGGVLP